MSQRFLLALEVSLHLAAGYRTFPYFYHSFNYFQIADSMPWGRYGLHRRRWAHCSHSFAAGLRRILICSDRCRELSTAEYSPCILCILSEPDLRACRVNTFSWQEWFRPLRCQAYVLRTFDSFQVSIGQHQSVLSLTCPMCQKHPPFWYADVRSMFDQYF